MGVIVVLMVAIGIGYVIGQNAGESNAIAQDQRATQGVSDREVYFPNTEPLAPDEMRIITCGTGMPSARESQAASCFLVELGNGDKFIFDGGTGIFISHLHTDHWGSFPAYFVGGWVAGRSVPLRVWGPSGETPERGTRYALENLRRAYTWDIDGRAGRLPPSGGQLEIHEFDYKAIGQVVYQENGVTIRSFPQIHVMDGSVGYTMEWNGLKFVYGGDSYPSKTFIEMAQNADVAIHECMMAAEDWIAKYKFPPPLALEVGTQIHTTPEAFGKIMSLVQPRMAIAFHFFNDFDTIGRIMSGVQSTYDGSVTYATDYLVWNVTADEITVREVFVNENAWPQAPVYPVPKFDRSLAINPSDEIQGQAYDVTDVDQAIYDRINAQYGTNVEMRMKAFFERQKQSD
jgi:ribonuclease Z